MEKSGDNKATRGRRAADALRRWLQRDSSEVIEDLKKGLSARGEAQAAPHPSPQPPAEVPPGAAGRTPAEPLAGKGTPASSPMAPARCPLPVLPERASLATRASFKVSGWGGSMKKAASSAWRRFPVGLTRRESLEVIPPLSRTWYRLLLVILGGALAWTLATALLQKRLSWVSLAVALLVACGVVLSLGTRFGLPVGVLAAVLAVLSLLAGELAVQMLYRHGVIEKLDLVVLRGGLERSAPAYRAYYFRLFAYRLIPQALLAFLVGLWPLKSRPYWRGFGG